MHDLAQTAPTSQPFPRIAIVGAGPGGLLCARVLQQRGVPVTVYDLDPSLEARDAGGTLDMHADTGQIALEDAGLLPDVLALARFQDQAKRSMDRHAHLHGEYVPAPDEQGAPEIDRGQLRALLAASLAPGTVQWGHKLRQVVPLGHGVHRLEFGNGVTAETELLIGADGAWSRVRPLLSPAGPHYSGVTFLGVRYDDVDTRHPEIARMVGAGHLFANGGDGRAIIAQRSSGGRVFGYLAFRAEADWPEQAGIDLNDRGAVLGWLRQHYQGWSGQFLPFLAESDVPFVNRPIMELPAPLTWATVPGVTLLGDAAHVMSPFGGFGANLALLDGAELARAIGQEPDLRAAVTRYEATMLARAGELAVQANAALDAFFSTTGQLHEAPDHAAEKEHYRRNAAEYRRRQSGTPAALSPETGVAGTWQVAYRTPKGEQQADLHLTLDGGALSGDFNGQPIEQGQVSGQTLSFRALITSPMKVNVAFQVTVDGDHLSGEAKLPFMSLPVSGQRTRAVRGRA